MLVDTPETKQQKAPEEHRSVFHHVCYLCYQDGSSPYQSLILSSGQTHIVKQSRKTPEKSAQVSPEHHTHTCSHQYDLLKNPSPNMKKKIHQEARMPIQMTRKATASPNWALSQISTGDAGIYSSQLSLSLHWALWLNWLWMDRMRREGDTFFLWLSNEGGKDLSEHEAKNREQPFWNCQILHLLYNNMHWVQRVQMGYD